MTSQNNALVEIALALAMAFFSIMILAMVSMSVSGDHPKVGSLVQNTAIASIDVRPTSQRHQVSSGPKDPVRITPNEVIIYYGGKFFDADLKEVAQTSLIQRTAKYLAVDPTIPTSEAVNVRKMFSSNSLVVTLLNDEWLKILKEKEK